MKTKFSTLLLILLTPIVFITCSKQFSANNEVDTSYLNEDGTDKFLLEKNKFSNFVVLSSSTGRNNDPVSTVYVFKGVLKNNTKNIYKSATVEGEVILVLENGNELNCSSIDSSFDPVLSSIANSQTKYDWKPNEIWSIDELKSCTIPIEYFNYPVKQVFTQYYIDTKDQINNASEKILVSQRDVTDRWLKAKEKIKRGGSDCTDYSFDISKYVESK
ncbi:hypothetical protein [Chryseobacterium limigenitum]|uniref:Lipoprotein n=1 Tax=Chryseobacterium limigenitum TaxID=1612149 RepID=A0A1K2IWM9_9FLAO|nr:hypothetical protein [Chryseobacterium limigenitum]SFZ96682.1 hypothetical protein SAMN05216324_1242 [Chryseobacterium limigenitum]